MVTYLRSVSSGYHLKHPSLNAALDSSSDLIYSQTKLVFLGSFPPVPLFTWSLTLAYFSTHYSPQIFRIQLWQSHQLIMVRTASFFSTSQWLGSWTQKSGAQQLYYQGIWKSFTLECSKVKSILVFSSFRIPRNFLEVFPLWRIAENTNSSTWGWLDVVHAGDVTENERKCSHPSAEKQHHSMIFPGQRIRPNLGYMRDLINTVWPFIAHTNCLLNGTAIWLFNGYSIPLSHPFCTQLSATISN